MQTQIISVLDHGAQPQSTALQTQSFQAALNTAARTGGTVEVPAGKYLVGSLRLYSNTTLLLRAGAVLLGSRDPEDYALDEALEPLPNAWKTDKCWEPFVKGQQRCYDFTKPGGRWCNGILRAVGAENITIVSEFGAYIDGQDCYDPKGEEQYRGPHGISMHHCKNLVFRGYTICNTGNWAHCLTNCENILMENVTVLAGHDGIHCTGCTGIRIADSRFYTGDDCIAGFGNVNTLVTGCLCNTACSGLRFGGTNALIRDCLFFGPARFFFRGSLSLEEKQQGAQAHRPHRVNMLSVFTYYADFSAPIPEEPGNIIIQDCRAENVDRFLHYNFSGNERWQAHRPLKSIQFRNIQATGIGMPLTAYGSANCPLRLSLENVDVKFRADAEKTAFLHGAHFEELCFQNVTVCKAGDAPLVKTWTQGGNMQFSQVTCGLPEEKWVEFTQEPFHCKSI